PVEGTGGEKQQGLVCKAGNRISAEYPGIDTIQRYVSGAGKTERRNHIVVAKNKYESEEEIEGRLKHRGNNTSGAADLGLKTGGFGRLVDPSHKFGREQDHIDQRCENHGL